MGNIALPGVFVNIPGTLYVWGNSVIDTAGDKVAFVLQAPKAGDIAKICYRVGTVTASDPFRVSLQSIDASGDPDGTILAHGDEAVATANTAYLTTLDAAYTVTKGQILAVVFDVPSYTDANFNISSIAWLQSSVFPYRDVFSGTWAKATQAACVGLEYGDGTYAYIPHSIPPGAVGNTNLDTDSDPEEYGNWFQVPIASQCIGVWFCLDVVDGATFKVNLSNAAGVLATATPDLDAFVDDYTKPYYLLWNTAVDLVADTDYYITLQALTGTAVAFRYYDVNKAAAMAQMDWGLKCYSVAKSDAGVYTTTATRRYACGVIIDQITTVAGGRASFKYSDL